MRTVQELVKHLKEHKDAIIVVGPGIYAENDKPSYSTEEYNENYNRKALVRDPNKLWNYFLNNMYKTVSEDTIKTSMLINKLEDISQIVIDQTTNLPATNKKVCLHGSIHEYLCPKCKMTFTSNYIFSKEPFENECECCGATLRPSVLLSGERYNQRIVNKVSDAFKASHTIILIGVDYSEEMLLKLIAEFGDLRAFSKNEQVLVAIQDTSEEFDPNELTKFDFIVRDNIHSALERLLNVF